RSHEASYTDSLVLGRIGIEGTRSFATNWFVALSGDWRTSHQQYAPFNGPPASRVTVDENRFDFSAAGGYDLGALLVEDGRLELTPMGGLQFLTARNEGFPFDLLGPSAGLRASWSLPPFTLRAVGSYAYNLNKDSSGPNAFLSPVSALAIRAGLQFRVNPAYAIELDYAGDAIKFEHVWRIGHGAVLGFTRSFWTVRGGHHASAHIGNPWPDPAPGRIRARLLHRQRPGAERGHRWRRADRQHG